MQLLEALHLAMEPAESLHPGLAHRRLGLRLELPVVLLHPTEAPLVLLRLEPQLLFIPRRRRLACALLHLQQLRLAHGELVLLLELALAGRLRTQHRHGARTVLVKRDGLRLVLIDAVPELREPTVAQGGHELPRQLLELVSVDLA